MDAEPHSVSVNWLEALISVSRSAELFISL